MTICHDNVTIRVCGGEIEVHGYFAIYGLHCVRIGGKLRRGTWKTPPLYIFNEVRTTLRLFVPRFLFDSLSQYSQRFLCMPALNAEVTNAFATLFYITNHMYDLQSQNLGYAGVRLKFTGTLLYMDSTV